MINTSLVCEIAQKMNLHKKMCWFNAVDTLMNCDDHRLKCAFYVEGFAIPFATVTISVEHGWIELAGQDIVDVTWLDEHAVYFPAFRYSREYVRKLDPDYLPLVHLLDPKHKGFSLSEYVKYVQTYRDSLAAYSLVI